MRCRFIGRCFLIAALALAPAVPAVTAALASEKGLPVPRFVSLRSDKVNVRTGPGDRYPVEWVFTRPNLPVEVVAEFDTWRKIRDHQGAEGWVHQSLLSGKRAAIVEGQVRILRRRPEEHSDIVARAEPGVLARLLECQGAWCRIEAEGIKGWLKRAEIWGVYANEVVKE